MWRKPCWFESSREHQLYMKQSVDNVVILHGYAETPEKVWLPWIHQLIEDRGIRVWEARFPDPLRPSYKQWLKAVEARARQWNGRTVIIGHSLGGVVALRLLEQAAVRRVRAVVTVSSPFAATLSIQALVDFFDRKIDWAKLRRRSARFITVHSKNDPLVPYDHAFRYREALGSKLVLTEKDGHFIGHKADAVWEELKRLL